MALFGGILGGAGALISGLASYKSAQKQMKYQSQMSNTAVQRQMADMRAAGINPILAAKYGGASTPTGASYLMPNIGQAAVEGYKGIVSAKQMQALTKQAEAQTKNIEEATKAIEQKLEFDNELHQERWQIIAARAGSDNMIASAIALSQGVNLAEVMRGRGVFTEDAIDSLIEAFNAFKSVTGREYAGIRDTLSKTSERAWEATKTIGKGKQEEAKKFIEWLVKQDKFVKDLIMELSK